MESIYEEISKLTGATFKKMTEEEAIQATLKSANITMEQYKQQEKAFNF